MSDPAISVQRAGKRYVKYDDTPMLVTRFARFRTRTTRASLWAIRDATFEVGEGEILGVIGRNGSGKSTLLRMMAGVTAPTEGSVRVRGRVAPLIAVGIGFHPELTGRENVYVSGIVLGLTRRDIDRRIDEIVDFAEISEFIDTPVKFYSSGMFVRLGFAVSVAVDPDVLIVDEVLSVGDIGFQLKCLDRMAEIRTAGASIVVVSHNLGAIRNLCQRTVVLHDGAVRFDGDSAQAISEFHRLLAEDRDLDSPSPVPLIDADFDPRARIEHFDLVDQAGQPTRQAGNDDEISIVVRVQFTQPVEHPILAVSITNSTGVEVYGDRSDWTDWQGGRLYGPGKVTEATVTLRPALASGSYSCSVVLVNLSGTVLAPIPPSILFYVGGRDTVTGVADLGARFNIRSVSPAHPAHGGRHPS